MSMLHNLKIRFSNAQGDSYKYEFGTNMIKNNQTVDLKLKEQLIIDYKLKIVYLLNELLRIESNESA